MAADLTPYLEADEFLAKTNVGDGGAASPELVAQLGAVDRIVDHSLGWAPGMFNTHAGVYVFDGSGRATLPLQDTAGRQYALTAATAIGIDTDNDLTYDGYEWLLSSAWVRGLPESNGLLGLPFEELEILSFIAAAPLSVWPARRAMVQIDGTFGYATVPEEIKELVAHTLHDLREAHVAGATGTPPTYEGIQSQLSNQTWRIWLQVKAEHNRRIPGLA